MSERPWTWGWNGDFCAVWGKAIVLGGTKAEKESRARLFTAAPELLEALEPFAKFACDTPHVNEPVCHNCRARAAIAKARGES